MILLIIKQALGITAFYYIIGSIYTAANYFAG